MGGKEGVSFYHIFKILTIKNKTINLSTFKIYSKGILHIMKKEYFPQRLKSARQMKGLSLRDLSDLMSNQISRQSISQYEKGAMFPTRGNLLLLCEALDVSLDYFNRPEIELKGIEFRKLNKLSAKVRQKIEAEATDFLSRFLELEELLGIEGSFENPLSPRIINSYEDVEKSAIELREKWNLGSNPIPNVVELLEEKKIKVFEIETDDAFSGMAAEAGKNKYVIVLNKNEAIETPRKRFTALHELAHIVLTFHKSLKTKEGEKQMEKYCHYFAGAVLFPKANIKQELGTARQRIHIGELLAIKEQYGISIQAILYRLRVLNFITEHHFRLQMKMIIQKGWKKKEPNPFIGKEHSNRLIQLLFRGIAEEIISTSKAAGLYGTNLSGFRKIVKQSFQQK